MSSAFSLSWQRPLMSDWKFASIPHSARVPLSTPESLAQRPENMGSAVSRGEDDGEAELKFMYEGIQLGLLQISTSQIRSAWLSEAARRQEERKGGSEMANLAQVALYSGRWEWGRQPNRYFGKIQEGFADLGFLFFFTQML